MTNLARFVERPERKRKWGTLKTHIEWECRELLRKCEASVVIRNGKTYLYVPWNNGSHYPVTRTRDAERIMKDLVRCMAW